MTKPPMCNYFKRHITNKTIKKIHRAALLDFSIKKRSTEEYFASSEDFSLANKITTYQIKRIAMFGSESLGAVPPL